MRAVLPSKHVWTGFQLWDVSPIDSKDGRAFLQNLSVLLSTFDRRPDILN
jgi:hypothetical protein